MSDFDITISTFESNDVKNGHSLYILRSFSIFPLSLFIKFENAVPTPYQPGSIILLCDHENTHGIALKPPISVIFLRDAGREPMFRLEISLIGVASKK